MPSEQSIKLGKEIREATRKWLDDSDVSMRELSRRIGADDNYVCSFLSRDPEDWAVPKHPTLGRLMSEIGFSEEKANA